jgi:hypothetical protein
MFVSSMQVRSGGREDVMQSHMKNKCNPFTHEDISLLTEYHDMQRNKKRSKRE